jgi:hypothetical protein
VTKKKKDKRFHFANAGASDELMDRKKFYDATKAEMAKQRYGLNEDSNTPYEDRTMKLGLLLMLIILRRL